MTGSGRKWIKHELVEIQIKKGSTMTKFYIPDLPNLRNVHLLTVEAYTNGVCPKSMISQLPVISEALAKSCFLTLQSYNGKNFLYQVPILDFRVLFNPALGDIFNWFAGLFVGQKVNYPKSYVEIADPSLISAVEDQVILFGIGYYEPKSVQESDNKASFRNQS